jgi:hypothetical protein
MTHEAGMQVSIKPNLYVRVLVSLHEHTVAWQGWQSGVDPPPGRIGSTFNESTIRWAWQSILRGPVHTQCRRRYRPPTVLYLQNTKFLWLHVQELDQTVVSCYFAVDFKDYTNIRIGKDYVVSEFNTYSFKSPPYSGKDSCRNYYIRIYHNIRGCLPEF